MSIINRILAQTRLTFISNHLQFLLFQVLNRKEKHFTCPICKYYGPFANIKVETGIRKYAVCPQCGALERHRIQYLVLMKLSEKYDFSQMSILHFAPEPFFKKYFRKTFKQYTSADLFQKDVDYKADLINLPFEDAKYDFVFASHVLEHIKDDNIALSEICRVLKPNGIAILPVPIVASKTVEYPEPNPYEAGHVRSPGIDYLERYSMYFIKVETYNSNHFPEKYQVFIYEDRTCWPTKNMPLRPAMEGDKHCDIVPVCYV